MVILTVAPHFGHSISITLVLIYSFFFDLQTSLALPSDCRLCRLDNPAGGGVERSHGLTPYLIAEGSGDRREPVPEAGVNCKR